MKKLHWYIFKRFLGPFAMTFFISLFVLLMQFLWKYLDDIVGKGLEFTVIAELLLLASTSLIPLAIPLSVLLASIMTFGTLGERFELLAMKASGISLLRIMRPLIGLTIFITMGAFSISNNLVPYTNVKFHALYWSIREQRPEMIVKEGIFSNEIDKYSIKVESQNHDTGMLYEIMIYDHTNGSLGNSSVTVADSGLLNISDDKRYMILTLFNGESYTDEDPKKKDKKKNLPYRRDVFEKEVITIEVDNYGFERMDDKYFEDGYKSSTNKKLVEASDSFKVVNAKKLEQIAVKMEYNPMFASRMRDYYSPDSLKENLEPEFLNDTIIFDSVWASIDQARKQKIIRGAITQIRSSKSSVAAYQTSYKSREVLTNKFDIEWHRKYTLSFLCMLFFFIGTSLGSIIRRGGFGLPVISSVFVFIIYHVVSMVGEKIARESIWFVWSGMWMSTFIFLPFVLVLSYSAITDSALLNKDTYVNLFKRMNVLRLLRKNQSKS